MEKKTKITVAAKGYHAFKREGSLHVGGFANLAFATPAISSRRKDKEVFIQV
ncbi:hypothetical protein Pyn_37766 [Prunus yedoensis var. nudiflora]|uniref:Uncharacterized protein n=1 Tax=Prunus yedoensis var. nudiflora TaxID=2094558 RepID=A0A314Z5T5_PRUYE|nr:hypothetical protein Pyn_37766 [Prunus yedoensis var. nudiflora]